MQYYDGEGMEGKQIDASSQHKEPSAQTPRCADQTARPKAILEGISIPGLVSAQRSMNQTNKKQMKAPSGRRKTGHHITCICISGSVLPAFFHRLAHPFDIFFAVVLVQIRCFNIGRGGGVGVVQQTVAITRGQQWIYLLGHGV